MKYQGNQHFSHHHVLIALKLDEGEEIKCNGCERVIHEPFHGCKSCNFYLHDCCLGTPRFLSHPSHLQHPLTLLPTPTYSTRSFTCDACGSVGNAFSLCCAHCEFDLHLHCASLPPALLLHQNHPHQLKLVFGSPYEDKSTSYACDLCRGMMNPNHWLYYCADCDFGAHLDCATAQRQKKNVREEIDSEVERMKEFNEAQERLAAVQMQSMIEARGRRAALDLLMTPEEEERRRRNNDYF